MNRFGVVDACLTVAAVFLAVTLALLALYWLLRRRAANAALAARAHSRSLIADPPVVATGVQVLQAIGASSGPDAARDQGRRIGACVEAGGALGARRAGAG